MTTDSYISHGVGGTTYAGDDAVRLFQAKAVRAALSLSLRGIAPCRVPMSRVLATATSFTQKPYRNGTAGKMEAIADLDKWIAAMTAALPVHGVQS